MTTDGVHFSSHGRVARIVLDDAESRNLLLPERLAALAEIAARLADDPVLQVLTITGAGLDWFSIGILTPALRASLDKARILDIVRLANRTFDAIEALPQVVIIGLNGHVRAGAVELALACDYRIAADHATLACPEAKWGGFPGAGGPVRLPGLVGIGHALDLLCTGREIDAAEMKAMRLVEQVVPRAELHDRLEAMARAIADNGPLATQGAKRILRMRQTAGPKAARDLSDTLRHSLEWSADVDEGIAAQQEGRKPVFTGF